MIYKKILSALFLCSLSLATTNISLAAEEIIEHWDGEDIDTGVNVVSKLLPPYGRIKGDKPNGRYGCLKRDVNPGKDIPSNFNPPDPLGFPKAGIGYYKNLCGESTSQNKYFNPSIRVRGQQCNATYCWTTSDILRGHGDCVTLAGGYGFPLHRMCARIALPANDETGYPADQGYRQKHSLNHEGAEKEDPKFVAHDDTLFSSVVPKFCLYRDPSFASIQDGTDLIDLNPSSQPFHETDQVHPVIQVIISLLDSLSIAGIMEKISNKIGDASGEHTDSAFLAGAADTVSQIFEWLSIAIATFEDLVVLLLQETGKINNAVDSDSYGCVPLPLGPYPPPFPDTLNELQQRASVQRICDKTEISELNSNGDNRCVVSEIRNNYIHNSIRISFDNFVPICRDGEDPTTTNKCVNINNIINMNASSMHILTNKMDILPHCNNSSGSCINTTIEHKCDIGNSSCQGGFRVIYGTKIGGALNRDSYFRDDLSDCSSTSSSNCQEIWGINTGQFIDVSIAFPAIANSYTQFLSQNFALVDEENNSRGFTASIVANPDTTMPLNTSQSTGEICVTDDTDLVGCTPRVPGPKPALLADSNDDYFAPSFTVVYEDGADKTQARIMPDSMPNILNIYSYINLAGDGFTSFVTDDTFAQMPFSGDRALEYSSLIGIYKDDLSPSDGFNDTDGQYLSGLEYREGKYHVGGKYACLIRDDARRCPNDPSVCVLTDLINRDVVSCKTFREKVIEHQGLSLCDEDNICVGIDSIPKLTSGTIPIKQCINGTRCYENDKALCVMSNSPIDRHDPSPSLGAILADNEYYDTIDPLTNFPKPPPDADLYGLRDKTPRELNLCIDIEQGACPAENNNSTEESITGITSWSAANVGEKSIGTCKKAFGIISWIPSAPLERLCVPNSNPFGPLGSSIVGSPRFKLEPADNFRCDSPW